MTGAVGRTGSRVRRRAELGLRRLRASALPIVQCAVAAGLALYVAGDLVGHARPFFAPIAAVISLGLTLNSRVRRAAELVVGVSLGVLVGDLLIAQIGSGVWQLALVVALAMAIAVFTDGGTLIVAQAGASAVLVTTLLPPGETGGIDRCVDALIGGAAGILIAALIPVNPIRIVHREARRALDELVAVLNDVAGALRENDRDAASAALDRSRDTQPMIDEMRAAVRSASEVASVSPLRRPRRRMLQRYRELAERTDYAVRNLRVLTRRALTAIEDGEPVPDGLADTLDELGTAVGALIGELGVDGDRERARGAIRDAAHRAAALAEDPGLPYGPSAAVLVAQVRSIAVDLLQATGLDRAQAQQALREEPR